ncbi:MAG: PEP-CTERM sorting domain-containing protein [Alphaproteobacteria bacterium]|nr:PEP-CTERM sorting domain-containing protein [Alphaproteobacteria bacterium]
MTRSAPPLTRQLAHMGFALAVLIGISLAGVAPARAAVVYSSPMATPSTDWFGYAASAAQGQHLASSFTLDAGGAVSGASWVGTLWPGWPQVSSFTLNFLDSVAGSGNVIASRSVTATVTDLGLVNGSGFSVYAYEASFADVELLADTEYYFSVRELTSHWSWSDGSDAGAMTWFSTDGNPNWGFPVEPGRAFALTGTLSDAVAMPAPGSLLMFGFALLGLGLSRRKRT